MRVGSGCFTRRTLKAVFLVFASLGTGWNAKAQMNGEPGGPAMAMGAGRGIQGTVIAVSGDRLTVKTERGEIYGVAVSPNTRVMKDQATIKLAQIHAGDGVGAVGELDAPNKTMHALYLMVVDAEQIRKARETLGKTWISGTVTAIEDTRLTILRPDQVSQVIAVDEDTSFRRGGRGMPMGLSGKGGARTGGGPESPPQDGGESVTLGDVKVGLLVTGTGTLKGGIFVPTMLGISDPGAGRGRRRQGVPGLAAPAAEPKVR